MKAQPIPAGRENDAPARPALPNHKPRVSPLLARAVMGGAVLYVLTVGLLHVLRPDYNPARRFLSEYAVGKFGALGMAAF